MTKGRRKAAFSAGVVSPPYFVIARGFSSVAIQIVRETEGLVSKLPRNLIASSYVELFSALSSQRR